MNLSWTYSFIVLIWKYILSYPTSLFQRQVDCCRNGITWSPGIFLQDVPETYPWDKLGRRLSYSGSDKFPSISFYTYFKFRESLFYLLVPCHTAFLTAPSSCSTLSSRMSQLFIDSIISIALFFSYHWETSFDQNASHHQLRQFTL